MKRKRVKKVEEIKQEEVKVETPQEQPKKHQQRSPWDDLVFMGPRPVSVPTPEADATEGTEVEEGTTGTTITKETTKDKPVEKTKRQGWSWI